MGRIENAIVFLYILNVWFVMPSFMSWKCLGSHAPQEYLSEILDWHLIVNIWSWVKKKGTCSLCLSRISTGCPTFMLSVYQLMSRRRAGVLHWPPICESSHILTSSPELFSEITCVTLSLWIHNIQHVIQRHYCTHRHGSTQLLNSIND